MPAAGPQIEIQVKPPTVLRPATVLTMSFFGLVLLLPVLVSMMVVSVLQFGVITFFLPLATIAAATFLLPLGFANPYVARLVRPFRPSVSGPEPYVVQLTRVPRLRTGLWAVLEDADDIGWLSLEDSAVVFAGDSFRLTIPYEQIKDLKKRNSGWRALFAYGPQTAFSVAGRPEAGTFLLAERTSWLLPTSRRIANEIYRRLWEKTQAPVRQPLPEGG